MMIEYSLELILFFSLIFSHCNLNHGFPCTGSWLTMESKLTEGSVSMKQFPNDLIDQIWTTGRPAQPNSTINALPIRFSGKTVKPV